MPITSQMKLLLATYMGLVTLAVVIGVSLQRLLERRPTTARYAVALSAGVMLAVCLLYLIPDALQFQHGIITPVAGGTDHASIGYALSIGFLSLLTVERYLLRAHHHHHHAPPANGGTVRSGSHADGHNCAHHHEPPHHHQHDPLKEALSPGAAAPPAPAAEAGVSEGIRVEVEVAWSTVLALCLHGLFDGVALYAAGVMPAMGPALATAVTLHKVPETATLLTVLRRGRIDHQRRLLVLLIYAAATPLGMVAAAQLLTLLSERGVALLMAFVAGSLLHLVTGHLLPEATQHDDGGPAASPDPADADHDAGLHGPARALRRHGAYGVMLLGFTMLLLARMLGAG